MCGRFSQGRPSRLIADEFGAELDDDLPEGLYNVPPTETIRVVVGVEGRRRLVGARWNFRPFWADAARTRSPWINARVETAWESPAFGPALRTRRCIIPADAFYEWDRSTTPRQPYAFGPSRPGGLLALAGIWAPASDGVPTAAILTTGPNALLATLHNRMPVLLEADSLDVWLDPEADLGAIQSLLVPAADDVLRMWPVSTAVNHVAADGPELLEPIPAPDVPGTLGLA